MSGGPDVITPSGLRELWQECALCCLLLDGGDMDLPRHVYTLENAPDEYYPLYLNTPYASVQDVGPALVKTGPHSPLVDWFIEEGAPARRGVVVQSEIGFTATVRHLQLILEMLTPSDEIRLFRYYDPVVMGYMAPVLRQKQLFRGPLKDFIYARASGNGPGQSFARLYGALEQPENMRDTSSMTAPVIVFTENDMGVMHDGAESAFCELLAGRLRESFADAEYGQCLKYAEQSLSVCREYGLQNVSSRDALAHLLMAQGGISSRVAAILADENMNEVHKRSELQRYFESIRAF